MTIKFRTSFTRDLRAIRDRAVQTRVRAAIAVVEAAEMMQDVGDTSKLAGSSNCFRIRVGDYRIGVILEEETVIFVRCLNRREIYRRFP